MLLSPDEKSFCFFHKYLPLFARLLLPNILLSFHFLLVMEYLFSLTHSVLILSFTSLLHFSPETILLISSLHLSPYFAVINRLPAETIEPIISFLRIFHTHKYTHKYMHMQHKPSNTGKGISLWEKPTVEQKRNGVVKPKKKTHTKNGKAEA